MRTRHAYVTYACGARSLSRIHTLIRCRSLAAGDARRRRTAPQTPQPVRIHRLRMHASYATHASGSPLAVRVACVLRRRRVSGRIRVVPREAQSPPRRLHRLHIYAYTYIHIYTHTHTRTRTRTHAHTHKERERERERERARERERD